MEWISDNWIWLLLGLGMVGMHMFGHGHGSRGGRTTGHGGGCCGTGAHGHSQESEPRPEKAVDGQRDRSSDPVCGKPLPPTGGKTSSYRGRVYRFCSRECREVFEANPDLYAKEGRETAPAPSAIPAYHPAGGARHDA